MARSFSLALNDLFDLDDKLAEKQNKVYEKSAAHPADNSLLTCNRKQAVSSQTSELEALEARLRATEERLAKAGITGLSSTSADKSSSGKSSPRSRTPLAGDTFQNPKSENVTSPLQTEFKNSRPNTGRPTTKDGRQLPGALPPTPGASEGEGESDSDYVHVRRGSNSADAGEEEH